MVKAKIYILPIILLFFAITEQDSYAQSMVSNLSGVVLDKEEGTRLSDVNVTNIRTKKTARTNTFGVFFIEASVGDSLSLSKVGYGPVKTYLYSLDDLLIEMQVGLQIETVVVSRQTKEGEMNEILRNYERKGLHNGGKNRVGTYLNSPATALYNLFGRDAKNAKRFERFMDRELEESKVDRIFNRTVVSEATQLEGDELQSFMDLYRPSHHSAVNWGQYELLNYISRSFETWKKNGRPKSERLPKLDIPPQEK